MLAVPEVFCVTEQFPDAVKLIVIPETAMVAETVNGPGKFLSAIAENVIAGVALVMLKVLFAVAASYVEVAGDVAVTVQVPTAFAIIPTAESYVQAFAGLLVTVMVTTPPDATEAETVWLDPTVILARVVGVHVTVFAVKLAAETVADAEAGDASEVSTLLVAVTVAVYVPAITPVNVVVVPPVTDFDALPAAFVLLTTLTV
jgi:hypothetical protein